MSVEGGSQPAQGEEDGARVLHAAVLTGRDEHEFEGRPVTAGRRRLSATPGSPAGQDPNTWSEIMDAPWLLPIQNVTGSVESST